MRCDAEAAGGAALVREELTIVSSKWDSVDPRGRARQGLRMLFIGVPIMYLVGWAMLRFPIIGPAVPVLSVVFIVCRFILAYRRDRR